MDLVTSLTTAQLAAGVLASLGTLLGLLAVAVRYVFTPRIVELVKKVVEDEFGSRDEAQRHQQRAEQSALKELNGRMKTLEERMAENEQASARTEATVQRIEEATTRQTQALQVISDGVTQIQKALAVGDEKLRRAEEDIKDLQRASRRRTR